MSVYFVLELIIFMMMKSTDGVCYFVLKMLVMMESTYGVCYFLLKILVMMGNTSDVSCLFFYCILLLDKNYRQYLVRYIIFIYIR